MHTSTSRFGIDHKIVIHIFFMLVTLLYIVPLLLIVSASFTNEDALMKGYSLIPLKFDTTAYIFAFKDSQQILNSYIVTAAESFIGTFLSVLVMSLCAYPLSRSSFKPRKIITYFILFTMLFNGGLIPNYIIITKVLNLRNSFWVYILPYLVSAWYIIILRTFFQALPESLVESAKMDGASELRIFFKIILPLSKPVLATVFLLLLLERWNDWYTALIYISKSKLFSLQYLLQKLLLDAEFAKQMRDQGVSLGLDSVKTPIETFKFAMCVLAAGPMLIVFPFFQKYFEKGLTVGSVKG